MDPRSLASALGGWNVGGQALYADLADAVAGLISTGVLRAGDGLPAERRLAAALSVSRGTVVKAFDRLASAGQVERVQGSGTTVTGHQLPSVADEFISDPLWRTRRESISLLQAQPTMLPEVMGAVQATELAGFGADLDSAEPLGWLRLREQIAAFHTSRGLPTEPHQVIVTSGAQQGVSLMVGAFVRPGDVVLGEEYTWPGLIDSVRHAGARFEPMRLDADGIDVGDLERAVIRFRPAMILLNPQHQNPTGTRLAPDRVADHDTDGSAVTVSSVCKVAWPGLRLGWVRADAQIVNQLRSHKAVQDMFTSSLSQAATMTVLDRYDEIVEARIVQLRRRCDAVLDAMRSELPDWDFVAPRGGMWLWTTLPEGTSADAFAQHAPAFGVQVASARQFGAVDADSRHVRIPFTAADDELAVGMRRLAEAWRAFDATRPAPAASGM